MRTPPFARPIARLWALLASIICGSFPVCPGANLSNRQSFFHVDCFKCAKCGNKVTADTNLLLLSDGSPVCANCSYNCNVCKQPILDEAIMTGDDSYHAHCFKCKVCRNRIDELVFAKTSQGIYCMDCHNERMIKIRRHAQKKAEREKAAAAGGSGSSSSRDGRARRDHNGVSTCGYLSCHTAHSLQLSSSTSHGQETPGSSKTYHSSSSHSTPRAKDTPSSSRRRSQPYVDDAFSPAGPRPSSAKNSPSYLTPLFPQPPQQSLSVNVAPPSSPTRPTLSHQLSSSSDTQSNGTLSATTPREKRRSINPGLVLNNSSLRSPASPPNGSPTLSPLSATFMHSQNNRSPTPPTHNGRDSPRMPSPLRDNFPEGNSSRPISNGSVNTNGTEQPPYDLTERPPVRQRAMSNVHRPGDEHFASLHPGNTNDSTPTRSRKLSSPAISVFASPDARSEDGPRVTESVRPRRSFDERPFARQRGSSNASVKYDRTRSSSTSRAPSRADVPHSVESSTDTEAELDESSHRRSESNSSLPPALPPKSKGDTVRSSQEALSPSAVAVSDTDGASMQLDSGSDDNDESPVEQTSHSTFIAPALPPIRFSMNTADFSDLLSSVGGINALKSLDHLTHITEKKEDNVPPTPPPSATANQTNGVTTPASDITVFPSSLSKERDIGKVYETNEDMRYVRKSPQRA